MRAARPSRSGMRLPSRNRREYFAVICLSSVRGFPRTIGASGTLVRQASNENTLPRSFLFRLRQGTIGKAGGGVGRAADGHAASRPRFVAGLATTRRFVQTP
jgi:hypothetical protein